MGAGLSGRRITAMAAARTPGVSGIHLSSLTTIAGKPAPTGIRARLDDQVGCQAASLCF
jgi:hypothetical protein